MKNSKITILLSAVVLLFPAFIFAEATQPTDCGLSEPPANGIYELNTETIRYMPPPGWKKNENIPAGSEATIEFMPSCLDFDILGISVIQPPFFVSTEELKRAVDSDPAVTTAEIITFAGTNAVKSTGLVSGTKTQQIMFYNDNELFMISFDAESISNFDKRLSEVDESLKSFEIIASPSKLKKYFNTKGSASEQLLQKFKTVSDKVCWEAMVQINQQAKKYANKELSDNQLGLMADEASLELMRRFRDIFLDSDSQALKILTKGFDDEKNRRDIDIYFEELSKLDSDIPEPIFYLLGRYDRNQLAGIELEFTVRLVKEHLRQSQ
jgi:hypothetical protein